jgi:hypothetical protein
MYLFKPNKAAKTQHIEPMSIKKFGYNILYSTKEMMNFQRSSRRDDLKMVCYMLCDLLLQGYMLNTYDKRKDLKKRNLTKRDLFESVLKIKEDMNVQEISVVQCKYYQRFVEEIFSLNFDEKP